jgi:hypothetical protein
MAKKATPVEYTEDIAAKARGLIAEGLSLRKIELRKGMPTKSAILSWLLQGEAYKAAGKAIHPKALFLGHYARARGPGRLHGDDIISIADDRDSSYFDAARLA